MLEIRLNKEIPVIPAGSPGPAAPAPPINTVGQTAVLGKHTRATRTSVQANKVKLNIYYSLQGFMIVRSEQHQQHYKMFL